MAGQGRERPGTAQQCKAEHGMAGQGRVGQGRGQHGTVGHGKAGQGKAGRWRAGQRKARHVKVGHDKAGGRAGCGAGRDRMGQNRNEAGRTAEQCEQGRGQGRLRDTGTDQRGGQDRAKARTDELYFYILSPFPSFYSA